MAELGSLSDVELWDLWKAALAEWGDIPESIERMKHLNGIEDEIVNRIRKAREERLASGTTKKPKLWNR